MLTAYPRWRHERPETDLAAVSVAEKLLLIRSPFELQWIALDTCDDGIPSQMIRDSSAAVEHRWKVDTVVARLDGREGIAAAGLDDFGDVVVAFYAVRCDDVVRRGVDVGSRDCSYP